MISLIRVHGEFLQFLLVFSIVQHCLGKNNICIDSIVKVSKSWPLAHCLYLHRVKHKSTLGISSNSFNIALSHFLNHSFFTFFQILQFCFCMHCDCTDPCSPVSQVSYILCMTFFFEISNVKVFCLSLCVPELLCVDCAIFAQLFFVSLSFILKGIVYFTTYSDTQTELG